MPSRSGQRGQQAISQKSRQKKRGSRWQGVITGPSRRKGGITLQRTRLKGVDLPAYDQFGLPTASKYAGLGPRCRENVATAIREGVTYQGQSGTTEEQVIYGELRRRGFTYGLGTSPRSFLWQSPIGGSIVDFEVWFLGVKIALRPQNQYWHGQQQKIASDDLKAAEIEARGYQVYDIWSGDSLNDVALADRFNQWFGVAS